MVRENQSTVYSRQFTAKKRKAWARKLALRFLGLLLLTVNCRLSTAFGQSFNVANLNEVRYANAYAGSNAGAKISACITDLPATGGACDARGLVGAQTISSAVTVGGSSKPATLILGLGVTYACAVAPCFIVDSNGHLEGAAISVLPALTSPPTYPAYSANTVIKLADGVNPGARGVIESANFANMTGTNGASGYIPSNFSIRNVSIDGNRAHNSSGMGIALYAFQDTLENVEVHSAASHGIWHEDGNATPGQTSVLVRGTHIRSVNNGGDGIHNIGPPDQMWTEVETSTNNGHGIYAGKSASSIGPGTSFWYAVDSYGNGGDGFRVEVGSHLYGAQLGEGNGGCGLNIASEGGGDYNVDAVHGNTGGGVCVGTASVAAPGNTVRGLVYTNAGGELVLVNSGGGNHFDLNLADWATPLKHVVGSFAASDSYDLRESGGGTLHTMRMGGDGIFGPLVFKPGNPGVPIELGDHTASEMGFGVTASATGIPFYSLYRESVGPWSWRVTDNLGSSNAEFASPALGIPMQMRNAATGSGEVRINDPLTVAGPIVSTVAPGTAPFNVASDTPVPILATQSHPRVIDCGTTTTCAGGFKAYQQEVIGTVTLASGAATVTGISPAFADTNFKCTAQDNSASTSSPRALPASASSITVTIDGGTSTDTVNYHCIGTSAGGTGGSGGGAAYRGPILPTAAADSPAVGTVAWSNPTNVELQDGSSATIIVSGAQVSHYLRASGYGFSVPTGATIDGIMATVWKTQGPCLDYSVFMMKTGAEATNNMAHSYPDWPGTGTSVVSYGGPTNLWGVSWTPTDINNSGFGFSLSAKNGLSGTNTCGIDAVKITVYYH